jgi:hypothetical protein
MTWQLIKVTDTKWIPDKSGYYTLINWIDDNNIRLDWMDKDDMPVVSFQGKADDVRKSIMQNEDIRHLRITSLEHAAYIGAELARCELLKKDYIQD